jgi:nitrous oxide reductase accessory protein NosL
MRYLLVGCFLLSVLIVGCAKKEEAPKGTPMKSTDVDTKGIKGKMVIDELPTVPPSK